MKLGAQVWPGLGKVPVAPSPKEPPPGAKNASIGEEIFTYCGLSTTGQ